MNHNASTLRAKVEAEARVSYLSALALTGRDWNGGSRTADRTGVRTSTAQVRAERSGTGNGRIYFISFGATNTVGGRCSGTVQAGVPHDQGQGSTPVDTGYRYDSTVVPP